MLSIFFFRTVLVSCAGHTGHDLSASWPFTSWTVVLLQHHTRSACKKGIVFDGFYFQWHLRIMNFTGDLRAYTAAFFFGFVWSTAFSFTWFLTTPHFSFGPELEWPWPTRWTSWLQVGLSPPSWRWRCCSRWALLQGGSGVRPLHFCRPSNPFGSELTTHPSSTSHWRTPWWNKSKPKPHSKETFAHTASVMTSGHSSSRTHLSRWSRTIWSARAESRSLHARTVTQLKLGRSSGCNICVGRWTSPRDCSAQRQARNLVLMITAACPSSISCIINTIPRIRSPLRFRLSQDLVQQTTCNNNLRTQVIVK